MSTPDEVRAAVVEVISAVTGIAPELLDLDRRLAEDLDLDSLSITEIAVAVNERLGVIISDEDIESLRTVGDVVGFAQRSN